MPEIKKNDIWVSDSYKSNLQLFSSNFSSGNPREPIEKNM